MKTFARSVLSVLIVLALVALRGTAADYYVVDVEGEQPAKVKMTELVRITGTGIAGAAIDAKVSGDGKLAATNAVRRIKNGNPVIGTTVKQFIVEPTKKGGRIEVRVTIKNPTSDTPTVQKYNIVVE